MSIDDVIVQLGAFLQPIVGGSVEIVRGQVNRVPSPDAPFIALTELLSVDLETVHTTWSEPDDEATYMTPARLDVQVDIYATDAADLCRRIMTLFRSRYATEHFTSGVAPLYCSDGVQMPFSSAEKQWESRWTVTVSLQYNQDVVVAQEYFTVATDDVVLIQVT